MGHEPEDVADAIVDARGKGIEELLVEIVEMTKRFWHKM